MILYKYYSYDAGIAAIESRRLGFRQPLYFNDPFELSSFDELPNESNEYSEYSFLIDAIREFTVILSLSKSFSNPLMWAHYGESNKGFVLGYDVSHKLLSTNEHNVISAPFGDVLYRAQRPRSLHDSEKIDALTKVLSRLDGDHSHNSFHFFYLLKEFFLTKHVSWAYEEEVRVVKSLNSSSPLIEYNNENTKGLYLLDHQFEIKEVYLGSNNKRSKQSISTLLPSAQIHKLIVDRVNWKLQCT